MAIAIAGCGWTSDEPVPTVDPTESQIERELGVAADQASAMSVQTRLAEGAVGATGVDTDQTRRGIEQLGAALGERLEAAGEMPGGEPCLQAYQSAVDARTSAGGTVPVRTQQDAYLAQCRLLPEEAQRCAVPGYASNHVRTCEDVLQRDDVRGGVAALHALMIDPS